jgi:hypothetical protein
VPGFDRSPAWTGTSPGVGIGHADEEGVAEGRGRHGGWWSVAGGSVGGFYGLTSSILNWGEAVGRGRDGGHYYSSALPIHAFLSAVYGITCRILCYCDYDYNHLSSIPGGVEKAGVLNQVPLAT